MSFKKLLVITLSLLLIFVLAACSQPAVEEDAVAIVNGEEILRADYEYYLAQVKDMYAQQGMDLDNEDAAAMVEIIKEQVLDDLISQKLLVQEAKNQGITANEEEVQNKFDQTRDSFETEEAFNIALEEAGLTVEKLKVEIANNLAVLEFNDQYYKNLDEEELAVTDEEIEELYEQYSAQIADMPDFEEVKGYLEGELMEQKDAEIFQALLDDLMEKSEIVLNL